MLSMVVSSGGLYWQFPVKPLKIAFEVFFFMFFKSIYQVHIMVFPVSAAGDKRVKSYWHNICSQGRVFYKEVPGFFLDFVVINKETKFPLILLKWFLIISIEN